MEPQHGNPEPATEEYAQDVQPGQEGQYAQPGQEGQYEEYAQPAEGDPYAQPVEGQQQYEEEIFIAPPTAEYATEEQPAAEAATEYAQPEEIAAYEAPAEEYVPEPEPVPEEPVVEKHPSLKYPAGLAEKGDTKPDIRIEDEDMRLWDEILQDAEFTQCADLHIKEDHPIHFRMSRGLRDRAFPVPTRRWIEKVIFHMCPEVFVEDFKKDREVDFSYYNPKFGRYRVNVFSQVGKWAMAIRYIKSNLPSIEKLGINPICLKLAEADRGITLLAGITGSGKSTTMAAMVLHLNRNFRKHIVTIEDPVEMVFVDQECVIEQREVGLDTLSFQRALKSALRQDPDMVLVGEMRDAISIGAAMRAADTGAMVLSTVHTRTAASVPGRLLDFFPPEEREMQRKKYAEVIVGAIAQRMCPKIGGGMIPAQEIMIGSPLVRQKIFDGELNKLPACIDASLDDGMISFNRCMYNLVNDGIITKETAYEKCTNKQQLEMWFQGIQISSGIV